MSILQQAYAIIELHKELEKLKKENKELLKYKEKYNEMLSKTIEQNNYINKGLIDHKGLI